MWLILSILLNIKNSKNILFISSLSFFYSPYATIGLIPISLYLYIKNSNSLIKDIISIESLYVICIIIVLGSFYLSGIALNMSGFIFQIVKNKWIIIPSYIFFILLEIMVYIIPTYKSNKKNTLYKIMFIELLLIPIYVISENMIFV